MSMKNATATTADPARFGLGAPQGDNPWLSDEAILSLSVWWVQITCGDPIDFAAEVSETFRSLDRDLRGGC
jgi:hypothetical protein